MGVVEGGVLHGGPKHNHGESPGSRGKGIQGDCPAPGQVCPGVQLGGEAGQVALLSTADTAGPSLGERGEEDK